jgi:hypothetical protein
VVVDEVTTVTTLLLVIIGLCDLLVGEKVVFGKFEDKLEAGTVKVGHADIGEMLKGSLVPIGDGLGEREVVLHGRQPELWNTLKVLCILLVFGFNILLLLFIILLLIICFSGLDLVF